MEKEDYIRQGKNNKRKGAEYERLICKIINDYLGTSFTRTPMSGGLAWKGDIINEGCKSIMDSIHFEVKNVATLHLLSWLRQAYTDAPSRTVPSVIAKIPNLFNNENHTRKKIQHIITMDLIDFLSLIKIIDDGEELDEEVKVEIDGGSSTLSKQYSSKRAGTVRKMQDRYSQEDRDRKEESAQASKAFKQRAKELQKVRRANFKDNIQRKRGI